MSEGSFEEADNVMSGLDWSDLVAHNKWQVHFWSGANAVWSSEWFLDRIRVLSGEVYDVWWLTQIDDGKPTVIQSRELAIEYFESSTLSGSIHNAEVIRALLETSENQEEEEEDEEDEEQELDDSKEEWDESQNDEWDESNDSDTAEWEDEWEWESEETWEQNGAGQGSEEQDTPKLPEEVKQQLEQYQEQIQRQQAQNQQYFNKQTPNQQPQDIFEAIFGQPQFRQEIGAWGGERDW